MRPCLIVYYSRTGLTEQVAKQLAAMGGCDIEAIREDRKRTGPIGFMRSVYESVTLKQPAILAPPKDPGDYDVVILGTPVWAGHMASPMRSYIQDNRGRFNHVALFCTMGGRGGEKVLEEVAALCGQTPLKQMVLSDREIQNGQYQQKLAQLEAVSHSLH